MQVKIVKFNAYESKSLKGFLTVQVFGCLEIRDCRYMETSDSRWIALPQRQYEQDGETKYANIVAFDKADYQEFQKDALEALDSYLQGGEKDTNIPF